MSVKVSSWVWHEAPKTVTGNDLILLLALADVADDNGRCRYVDEEEGLTYAALERKSRVSRSTVIRIVARLREAGLVEQIPGVKGRPNEFRVLVPWAQKSGSKLTPKCPEGLADSVSSETDSVSSDALFGVNADDRSSYRRTDVTERVARAPRGTRIPDPFVVTREMREWASEHAPLVNVDRCTVRFVNHWRAKTGRDATKLDWPRTWQNWLLKDQTDEERRGGVRQSTVDHGRSVDQLLRERASVEQRAVSA